MILGSAAEAKYLGVTLSNNYGVRSSQWKSHISEVTTKASQRLGFLRRNLKGAPYKLREIAYLSLVRSALEYCGAIWDPTVKEEASSVEMIQRRAARWARGARGVISVTGLLRDLKWDSLADRRRDQRLCIFYKILHGDINIDPLSVDLIQSDIIATRGAHKWKLKRLAGKDKSSPLWKGTIARTIPEWNQLHSTTVEAGTFTQFKSRLQKAP